MPPGRRPPHHHHRHALSALNRAADPGRLADTLESVIPDRRDRDFVVRCILDEGPAHHRAASWALLMLASQIASRLGVEPATGAEDDAMTVRLRLPPHLAGDDDSAFPVRLPLAPLRAIAANERDVEALADALVDGPPHHALANAALVSIFHRILLALDAEPSRE